MPQLYRNGKLVVVIECPDLARSVWFWAGVLGFTASRATSGPYRSLVTENREGIEVLLQQVPEGKHHAVPGSAVSVLRNWHAFPPLAFFASLHRRAVGLAGGTSSESLHPRPAVRRC